MRDAFSLAVVYPVRVRDVGDVARLRETVAFNYRGNHAPLMQQVILADFPDSASPELLGDEKNWEALCKAVDSLNAEACASGGCSVHTAPGDTSSCGHPFEEGPFLALRRRRRWNERERRWMGWERKRGKLEEFNKAVLGEAESSFELTGPVRDRLSHVRYVLTLDEDSGLPPPARPADLSACWLIRCTGRGWGRMVHRPPGTASSGRALPGVRPRP
jgi:cyclic beta-1,2-glucan synthetase